MRGVPMHLYCLWGSSWTYPNPSRPTPVMPQVCIIGPSRGAFLTELLKDSLLNDYRDPQMEGNPQITRRIACLGMNPIAGVFLPPRAVFIRVAPKPIGTPIRSYCTIADQFSRFLRGTPCFQPILPKSYRRTAVRGQSSPRSHPDL